MHFAKPVPSNATRRVVKQGMEMEKLGNELLFPPFANFSSRPLPFEQKRRRKANDHFDRGEVRNTSLPSSSLFSFQLYRENRDRLWMASAARIVRKKMRIIGRASVVGCLIVLRMQNCVHIVFACKICGLISVKRVFK